MPNFPKYPGRVGFGPTTLSGLFDEWARGLKTNHRDVLLLFKTFITYLAQERTLDPKMWQELSHSWREHELHSFFLQDPFTGRAFNKPRRYAGDAVMLDFIYGHQDVRDQVAQSSELGQRILAYTAGASPAARAVRWRCAQAAHEIEAVAIRVPKAHVLAFACGHLREIELVHPELRRRIQITAADVDDESLNTVANAYGRDCALECRHISVRNLLSNQHGLDRRFDLVYALGLFDYLTDKMAERVVQVLWSLVAPEGKLMLANFAPETFDAPYMEAGMDWWLQYRSLETLQVWTALIDSQPIVSQENFKDPFSQVAYLSLVKSPA